MRQRSHAVPGLTSKPFAMRAEWPDHHLDRAGEQQMLALAHANDRAANRGQIRLQAQQQ
jgi:hypothetical protein